MATSKRLRELQAKKATLAGQLTDLNAAIGDGEATPEQQAQWDGLKAQITSANSAIQREQDLLAEQVNAPGMSYESHASGGEPLLAHDPKGGFKSIGEFASEVRNKGQKLQDWNAAAPSTYGNESAGADGGYLVPPEFAREIFRLSLGEESLLTMTDNTNVSGNSMVFPKDETTPWGTDGVRAYWQQEATAATATKPKLGAAALRLHKLMALVPLTDELLADADALTSYLPAKIGDSIRWKTNEAILVGTGAGQPLGMFTGGAAVTVAGESGQTTGTIQLINITKMIARLPPGSFPRAFWQITPDALPALFGLTLGNYPIYLPINQGAQGSPYGTLMGRPLIVSQHAAALSSEGDVQLIDPFYYRTIQKASGVETATSMHLYFDAGATAFRTMFRVDGQPKIAAPISQAKGSNTLSPFIKLGARSG